MSMRTTFNKRPWIAFLAPSNFFTIDVADSIGKAPTASQVSDFVAKHPELIGTHKIPGIERPVTITAEAVATCAGKYLLAVEEAGAIYRYIADRKGADEFVAEVSMDETDSPQTPPELLIILAALADANVPLQTIAPKFTGRFNKGWTM